MKVHAAWVVLIQWMGAHESHRLMTALACILRHGTGTVLWQCRVYGTGGSLIVGWVITWSMHTEAFIPHSLGIPTDWHASISVSTAIPTERFLPLPVEIRPLLHVCTESNLAGLLDVSI
ncbi:hypothetical protein A0H81_13908 [Grifola frondosa]|uniref:Uncharacterized protein n=1 Tax=Grifola frondosa TaxID=5627 RepID=A0A1C7LNF2_GRIFR|nr:hypothetical protein A0H81_13908 [Grifola frondosa]